MNQRTTNWELAEAYASGTMPEAERQALQSRLETDPVFAADFHECMNMLAALDDSGRQKRFRNMLVSIEDEQKDTSSSWKLRTIPLRTHYLRTGAVAAGIALLTTLSTFWMVNNNHKKQTSQYSVLKRDLDNLKRFQKELNQKISTPQNPSPAVPANYSGTGFALTNDGYFVTNYHVTEGADSVYIQNREGHYFKATLVSFDAKADVAILKVENKSFRFGKNEVPYTLASGKKSLGSKVFTLGFPQDEIVYSEGYIASKNGFLGDSMQYRLELPASEGQSGAPVVDGTGSVIGIVTGKESESEGTTYAVGSKAIHKLIQSLPKEQKIKLPKSNKLAKMSREQQIENLEFYTCSVKVYKK